MLVFSRKWEKAINCEFVNELWLLNNLPKHSNALTMLQETTPPTPPTPSTPPTPRYLHHVGSVSELPETLPAYRVRKI